MVSGLSQEPQLISRGQAEGCELTPYTVEATICDHVERDSGVTCYSQVADVVAQSALEEHVDDGPSAARDLEHDARSSGRSDPERREGVGGGATHRRSLQSDTGWERGLLRFVFHEVGALCEPDHFGVCGAGGSDRRPDGHAMDADCGAHRRNGTVGDCADSTHSPQQGPYGDVNVCCRGVSVEAVGMLDGD